MRAIPDDSIRQVRLGFLSRYFRSTTSNTVQYLVVEKKWFTLCRVAACVAGSLNLIPVFPFPLPNRSCVSMHPFAVLSHLRP